MGANIASVVGGAVNVGAGVATMIAAQDKIKDAEAESLLQANVLKDLQNSRQDIVAGGATALAMAAAKSKKEVSASLETQEVNNQKMRAEGQMKVDELKAKGEDTKWLRQEERDLADLDRTQAQLDNSKAQEVAANDALWGARSTLFIKKS